MFLIHDSNHSGPSTSQIILDYCSKQNGHPICAEKKFMTLSPIEGSLDIMIIDHEWNNPVITMRLSFDLLFLPLSIYIDVNMNNSQQDTLRHHSVG